MLEKAKWWMATAKNLRGQSVRFKVAADESYSEERVLQIFKETCKYTELELEDITNLDLTTPEKEGIMGL